MATRLPAAGQAAKPNDATKAAEGLWAALLQGSPLRMIEQAMAPIKS